MKNLLFLLISFFCLAGNAQEKKDSMKVVEMAKVLEQKTQENKKLMEENKRIQKENENLLEIVFLKIKKLISHRKEVEQPELRNLLQNKEGIKTENQNEPVTELPEGLDSVRGGWIYRLLHRNDYYFKRYKIINNEKIYLD
ncbi:hypothetical protein U9K52_09785 [Chryseobacterium sp. MHB01]|uniref:hypothetical protein n=1 Tax=Chryseobacterium sp. MHB01 TaxID=3109433 RepID=UPI002B0024C5|nr:hypothetical protein [Chryseobacterium sp. MHB01]MEA1849202.1 hypothetical protein [Chryseobacterium sp. MHB01]